MTNKTSKTVFVIASLLFVAGLLFFTSTAPAQRSTPVTVINGESAPVPIIDTSFPREPHLERAGMVLQGGVVDESITAFTIPLDKIFVIENINLTANLFTDQVPDLVTISTGTQGFFPPNDFALTKIGRRGLREIYSANHSVRLYARGPIGLTFRRFEDAGVSATANLNVTFNGYLVPLASPSLAP